MLSALQTQSTAASSPPDSNAVASQQVVSRQPAACSPFGQCRPRRCVSQASLGHASVCWFWFQAAMLAAY